MCTNYKRWFCQSSDGVIEYQSTDHDGSLFHKHEWDEVGIVVDGEAEFRVGDQVITGGRGTVQFLTQEMARLLTEGSPFDQIAERTGQFGVTLL